MAGLAVGLPEGFGDVELHAAAGRGFVFAGGAVGEGVAFGVLPADAEVGPLCVVLPFAGVGEGDGSAVEVEVVDDHVVAGVGNGAVASDGATDDGTPCGDGVVVAAPGGAHVFHRQAAFLELAGAEGFAFGAVAGLGLGSGFVWDNYAEGVGQPLEGGGVVNLLGLHEQGDGAVGAPVAVEAFDELLACVVFHLLAAEGAGVHPLALGVALGAGAELVQCSLEGGAGKDLLFGVFVDIHLFPPG